MALTKLKQLPVKKLTQLLNRIRNKYRTAYWALALGLFQSFTVQLNPCGNKSWLIGHILRNHKSHKTRAYRHFMTPISGVPKNGHLLLIFLVIHNKTILAGNLIPECMILGFLAGV